ncbi:glycosyltransferase WbuB [Idiomarina sp. MD25a]|uniref:glycosyltransferase family 4 protein n=1 Tax=Idiomarina sp. MD25a TaxID=1889913 RepID=UPI0008F80243|nr:glycosyltransferase family 4 protein [Idiomarina sp. MD25a]OIM99625.1 glycosyltransferase WbuB [Idiomarina sp. MD25a]
MKLLVLSFYFQPDLCAGSFRCTALIDKLRQHDLELEVITTLPNRYAGFNASAPEHEQDDNVTVHRVALPGHESGMVDQAKAFFSFYTQASKIVKNEQYVAVFATSSRLLTAFLGARIARKKGVPLYLDIRDIFVDTLNEVLSGPLKLATFPALRVIENYTFKAANRINLVSGGFADYFSSRYPHTAYRWFTNGIDREFIDAAPLSERPLTSKPLHILYAGNIGEGQGLHKIIPEFSKRVSEKARISIIGAGGRAEQLREDCEGLSNVQLLPPVSRDELIDAYKSADVLFLHLNDYEAFKKVLPSKIFEYAALGKPILAGVGGFAKDFINQNVSNAEVFEPGDSVGAFKALDRLSLIEQPRAEFVKKYSRKHIMEDMANDIIAFVGEKNHG